jgi:hypothetical protein
VTIVVETGGGSFWTVTHPARARKANGINTK